MLWIYFAIVAFTVILDQVTKYAVAANMAVGDSIPIIKNVLHLTYVTNDGAAMGMMDDYRWIFMSVSTVALIGISVWICICHKKISKLSVISFSMVVGGGIGNMIDRVFNGETFGDGVVVDFIDFCAFPKLWMWIFNVADAFVCVGVALVVLDIILEEVKKYLRSRSDRKLIAENSKADEITCASESTSENISDESNVSEETDQKTAKPKEDKEDS